MKRMFAISIAVLPMLAGIWMPRAQTPSEHIPIPESAPGETDFAACLTCHTDKNAGATVHAVIEMGCETCHSVDQDEDYTEVYFETIGNELCLTCHGDKEASAEQLTLHNPVRRDLCITCHDPHSSANEFLLRKPVGGTDTENNLCLTCHENITAQLTKANLHMAVEFGCATCHETHKSEPADTNEGVYHLTAAQPDLCLTCHDSSEESFSTAHGGQPVESAACTMCHNPHGSDNAKLLNNFVHAAFEMGCETCHDTPAEGTVILQEGAGKDLCLMCHSDVGEAIEGVGYGHLPLELDDGCITCHNPHATTSPKLLKAGPVDTCLSCHTDLDEARAAKKNLHRPVFEAGCAVCHKPHGGEREKFLRAEVNDTCLACHNRRTPRNVLVKANAGLPFELFDGAVEVPTALLKNIPTLPLAKGATKGHPVIASHPVAGKYPLGDNMTCVTCHEPHAADGSTKLFITQTEDSRVLCQKCH